MDPETLEDKVERQGRELRELRTRFHSLLRHLGLEDFDHNGDPQDRSTIPAPPPSDPPPSDDSSV